jgi:hypothetical protein
MWMTLLAMNTRIADRTIGNQSWVIETIEAPLFSGAYRNAPRERGRKVSSPWRRIAQ